MIFWELFPSIHYLPLNQCFIVSGAWDSHSSTEVKRKEWNNPLEQEFQNIALSFCWDQVWQNKDPSISVQKRRRYFYCDLNQLTSQKGNDYCTKKTFYATTYYCTKPNVVWELLHKTLGFVFNFYTEFWSVGLLLS